jgi:hypothetical protein
MGLKKQRRVAGIVTVILVLIAIVIVVCIIAHVQGMQPFTRLEHPATSKPPQPSRKEQLRNDARLKAPAPTPEANARAGVEAEADLGVEEQLEQAQHNARMNVRNAAPTSEERVEKKPPPAQLHHEVPVLVGESIWDIMTPKEDTMREYGVTQTELDELVAAYRSEHAYEVEKAPTTLTFSMDRWERANDTMQDAARNSVVERRPYEDGLVTALYRDGEL